MNRVLFVTDSLFPLGLTRGLIARALPRNSGGDEIHLAAPCDQLDRDWLIGLPITIHDLPGHQQGSSAAAIELADGFEFDRRGLRTVFRLRSLIRELVPHSIEACGEQAANWTALAAIRPARRSSWNPQWVYHEFRVPLRPQPSWQWFQGLGAGFGKAIVTHARLQESLRQHRFRGPIEIAPISLNGLRSNPNFGLADPIAARQLLRAHLGLSESTWIAGTVAPLIPRSRLKDLIWATDQLTVVRDDVHLVIFGKGPQLARLRAFAGFTEAADHIHFLGEPPDAWRMFQGLDVFWQSHLQEPLPQNLIAAMGLGIPVVSVLGPGTSELIRHQQTGLGVNFGGRDEFARWTKYLIEQTASAKIIRQQGQEFVEYRLRL